MNEKETSTIWQVDARGSIYEASFDELIEWIKTGSLQPNDKIRKGNLRWIEAGRAPGDGAIFHEGAQRPSFYFNQAIR